MATNKSSGQGEVRDPEHDRRLKENRDQQSNQSDQGSGSGSGDGRGQVKDPKNDGRLKENR